MKKTKFSTDGESYGPLPKRKREILSIFICPVVPMKSESSI